ncbi:MAG: 5-methyltetrahydrofolate--homocysteine methyltransferase [Bacteroidales bacterium]|nr:5-methyltetrahydrofolate--homocysteine methyltransferase [Candidatus Physcousia equi]
MTDIHYEIHDLLPYINWQYFFHAWGLPARFGSLTSGCSCVACRQAQMGNGADEAQRLYDDARNLLSELDGRFQTHARILICDAYAEGDDIKLLLPHHKANQEQVTLPLLRQQQAAKDGFCHCLSDFILPKDVTVSEEKRMVFGRIGLFLTSVDEQMERQRCDDDYLHLLHQTLADRLAEATAEKAHEEVRRNLWGYAPAECMTQEELFREAYQGIRPAVGYPSLPDQSFNFVLDEVLHFAEVGVRLTESGAMQPHASTSGLMIAHPMAHHFSIGTIDEEQLADYAQRRGMDKNMLRRFLRMA